LRRLQYRSQRRPAAEAGLLVLVALEHVSLGGTWGSRTVGVVFYQSLDTLNGKLPYVKAIAEALSQPLTTTQILAKVPNALSYAANHLDLRYALAKTGHATALTTAITMPSARPLPLRTTSPRSPRPAPVVAPCRSCTRRASLDRCHPASIRLHARAHGVNDASNGPSAPVYNIANNIPSTTCKTAKPVMFIEHNINNVINV
jgi:hypothetical protein